MALVIPIMADIDVFKARRAGREMAREIGFQTADLPLIEIAISELASNVLRHAGSGTITVNTLDGGIEIISEDTGGGIEDIEAVLSGTKKSIKGLGIGLAGVKRMMDEMKIRSEKDRGTSVITRKWIHRPSYVPLRHPGDAVSVTGLMNYGICSIPAYGAELNGDAYVVREFDNLSMIAVIDGLGHGKEAAAASGAAVDYLLKNYTQTPVKMIEGCHHALKKTRGVVMGIARVDFGSAKLTWSGIGNIRIKIAGTNFARPTSVPGIVGSNFRHAREENFSYSKEDTLFIYSDGISDSLDPSRLELKGRSLQQIAEDVVREFGKNSDDNTIVVAKEE